ncbi:Hypothetical_protein [Hexamita inflata]|uniref:Hypothetical_protein n=1 Tax=Hexamita inflata TaxID=28002 RepID=A0AA86QBQ5_9EUKA|nr:Hypothetical protein HINF_LOCUS39803 [Hexamita inflata]
MNACYIKIRRFYGVVQHSGYYEIQNNCLLAYYHVNDKKVEFFFNINELTISIEQNMTVLCSPKQKIKFLINERVEADSQTQIQEDSDKYFDFDANGSKMYENEGQTPFSFVQGGTLRFFDE